MAGGPNSGQSRVFTIPRATDVVNAGSAAARRGYAAHGPESSRCRRREDRTKDLPLKLAKPWARAGRLAATNGKPLLTWLYALLVTLAAAAVLWLLWLILQALAPVVLVTVVGALLAVILGPLADRLQRTIRSRPVSALAVILLLIAPFVALATWLVTTVQREAQGLLDRLPQQLQTVNTLLGQWQAKLTATGIHVDLVDQANKIGSGVLQHSITVLATVATVTTDTVLVLMVAFFLIWDGRAMARSAFKLLPSTWQPTARDAARILTTVVADYVRGQFLVGAVFGLIVGASMALLGLPYAALLGFLAGLFELLPTVGPLLGAVGPVALGLAQPFPHVIWVILVLVGAQQLESNVLVPRISGGAVGLHPLTVILAVFAAWHLWGVGGALLAVPLVGVGREVMRHWWQPSISAPPQRMWPARGVGARPPSPLPGPDQPQEDTGLAPIPARPPAPPAPERRGQRVREHGR